MKKKNIRDFKAEKIITFIADVVILLVLGLAAFFLFPNEKIGPRDSVALNILFALVAVCFMYWLEKYETLISELGEKRVITVLSFLYTFLVFGAINLLLFMETGRLINDAFLFAAGLVAVLIKDRILHVIMNKRFITPRLLIVGAASAELIRMKRVRYGVHDFYETWYETLEGIAESDVADYIKGLLEDYEGICIFNDFSDAVYDTLVNVATDMNKDIYIIPKIVDVGKINARIVRFDDILSLHLKKYHVTGIELFIKRFMDIVISLVMTLFAALPMLVIALLIKLTSPGPVFYKQQRLTKDKKIFWIYKFRTMIPDAEKHTGPVFAQKDDPRITPIGKILRSMRLDELPQLLNILKGDMSVVGPRPERPEFVELFSGQIRNYDYRFKLKAGLTSLSHIYGRYSTQIYDRTYYDLYYIARYSLLLDLKIMLLTSKTMFLKDAAEGVEAVGVNNAKELSLK